MYFVLNYDENGDHFKDYYYTFQGATIDYALNAYANLAVDQMISNDYKKKFDPTKH